MLSLGTVVNYYILKWARMEDSINSRAASLNVPVERAKKVDQ